MKQFVECMCRRNILRISREVHEPEVELAMYRSRRKPSIKDQLRVIWRIIKYGMPFEDDMVLEPADVHKMSVALGNMYNQICAELEENAACANN